MEQQTLPLNKNLLILKELHPLSFPSFQPLTMGNIENIYEFKLPAELLNQDLSRVSFGKMPNKLFELDGSGLL